MPIRASENWLKNSSTGALEANLQACDEGLIAIMLGEHRASDLSYFQEYKIDIQEELTLRKPNT